jgi:hypothetical protein
MRYARSLCDNCVLFGRRTTTVTVQGASPHGKNGRQMITPTAGTTAVAKRPRQWRATNRSCPSSTAQTGINVKISQSVTGSLHSKAGEGPEKRRLRQSGSVRQRTPTSRPEVSSTVPPKLGRRTDGFSFPRRRALTMVQCSRGPPAGNMCHGRQLADRAQPFHFAAGNRRQRTIQIQLSTRPSPTRRWRRETLTSDRSASAACRPARWPRRPAAAIPRDSVPRPA